MFWIVLNDKYQIVNKHAFNNSQDIVLTLGIIALVASIATKGVVMKENPIPVPTTQIFLSWWWNHHLSTFVIFLMKTTLPFLMLLFMSMWIFNLPKNNLYTWVCHNVVDLLKVMSLTLHNYSKLKYLNYNVIIIEFVNCLPIKFNGDILFELPHMRHSLGPSEQLQGMDRKYNGHAWCKLQTNNIKNLFGLGFRMMKCLGHLCC